MQLMDCRHCRKSYPPSDFEITKTVGDKIYRRRKCKFCKWKTQRLRVHRISAWLAEYKKKQTCQSCGVQDHRVLTFHHRTGTDKSQNVSDLACRDWSRKRVQAEIEKCDVLCVNCHAIVHYEMKQLENERLASTGEAMLK